MDLFTFCIDRIASFLSVPNVCKPVHNMGKPDPCYVAGSKSRRRCSCCAISMIDPIPAFETHNRYIFGIAEMKYLRVKILSYNEPK